MLSGRTNRETRLTGVCAALVGQRVGELVERVVDVDEVVGRERRIDGDPQQAALAVPADLRGEVERRRRQQRARRRCARAGARLGRDQHPPVRRERERDRGGDAGHRLVGEARRQRAASAPATGPASAASASESPRACNGGGSARVTSAGHRGEVRDGVGDLLAAREAHHHLVLVDDAEDGRRDDLDLAREAVHPQDRDLIALLVARIPSHAAPPWGIAVHRSRTDV